VHGITKTRESSSLSAAIIFTSVGWNEPDTETEVKLETKVQVQRSHGLRDGAT
jgi:hypothetical protein